MFTVPPLPRTLAAALRDARSPKERVRASAVVDLGRLAAADSQAAQGLVELLSSDESEYVRSQAAVALADAGASSTLSDLIQRARSDPHPRVTQMCLLAIGELAPRGHKESQELITAQLSSAAPAIRFQALIAASRVLEVVESELNHALSDPDALVRHIAVRIVEERAEREPELIRSLKAALLLRLTDESPRVRLAAAIALAAAGVAEAEPVLCELLTGRGLGFQLEDEQEAVLLAGRLGLRAAMPGLRRRAYRALFSHPLEWEAQIALARLGEEKAKRVILRGLSGWSRDKRTLAVVAAGRARLAEARGALEAMRHDPARAEPAAVSEALRLLET